VDGARHDADFAFFRLDDPGAVGPDQAGLGLVEGREEGREEKKWLVLVLLCQAKAKNRLS
jgi:hypothetical protein